MFVVDWLSNKKDGRVVVLKDDEGTLNTYTGHPYIHKEGTLFNSLDIKTTPCNNTIICDYATSTLHLLNSSGDFLTYFDTKAIGVIDLCSITFSKSGTLYIGTTPENHRQKAPKTGKAKLFELEFNKIFRNILSVFGKKLEIRT